MAEYINRELLKKRFLKRLDWLKKDIHDEYSGALYDCCEVDAGLIDEIPAADVAPVVRCKDCKDYDMGVCLKIYSDGNVHPEAWQSRKPDDFCSYGERKDGADAKG
jgi:hypothetical protein